MVKFDWLEDNAEPAVDPEGNPVIGTLYGEDVIYKESMFHWKGFSSADIDSVIHHADRENTKSTKKRE